MTSSSFLRIRCRTDSSWRAPRRRTPDRVKSRRPYRLDNPGFFQDLRRRIGSISQTLKSLTPELLTALQNLPNMHHPELPNEPSPIIEHE